MRAILLILMFGLSQFTLAETVDKTKAQEKNTHIEFVTTEADKKAGYPFSKVVEGGIKPETRQTMETG